MDSFWSGLFIFIHEHYRDTAVRTLFPAGGWTAFGVGCSYSSHGHYSDTAVRTLFPAGGWTTFGAGCSKSSHESLQRNSCKNAVYCRWMDSFWSGLFNRLGRVNWLAKIRTTQLYHDTPKVINRYTHYAYLS
jgi:hypothetical protein